MADHTQDAEQMFDCCPFCAHTGAAIYERDQFYFVMCTNCTAEGPSVPGRQAAREAWNRRSIPQGDEPAKAAQGDDLPPMPWDDSEANRANKITVSVGDLSDAMRDYGAACRAGRAKGEDARDAVLESSVITIRKAIEDYYRALNAHQHGGVAMDRAFRAIECELGMSWDMWTRAEDAARSNQTGGKE